MKKIVIAITLIMLLGATGFGLAGSGRCNKICPCTAFTGVSTENCQTTGLKGQLVCEHSYADHA